MLLPFLRFPAWNRMFPVAETYVSREENVYSPAGKYKKSFGINFSSSKSFKLKDGNVGGMTFLHEQAIKKGIPFGYPFFIFKYVNFYCSYSFFRFGFIGNQPFSTRSRCSKISLIVQKEENEKTPRREDTKI